MPEGFWGARGEWQELEWGTETSSG